MMMYIDGMEDVPSGAFTAVKSTSPLLSVCWADMPVSDVGGGCVDLRDHSGGWQGLQLSLEQIDVLAQMHCNSGRVKLNY
jgi:hypothetical protein